MWNTRSLDIRLVNRPLYFLMGFHSKCSRLTSCFFKHLIFCPSECVCQSSKNSIMKTGTALPYSQIFLFSFISLAFLGMHSIACTHTPSHSLPSLTRTLQPLKTSFSSFFLPVPSSPLFPLFLSPWGLKLWPLTR